MKVWWRTQIWIWLLASSCIFLTGCWDYADIDRRGILLGIGVDWAAGDGAYHIARATVDVANSVAVGGDTSSQSGSSGGNKSVVITREAPSLIEALEKVEASLDRQLFLSFLQSMVIGEDLATSGIDGVFDWINRDPSLRRTVCIYITPGSAEDVLKFSPVLGSSPGMWLRAVSENSRDSPRLLPCVTAWEYRRDIFDTGVALLPRVEMIGDRPAVEGTAVMYNHRLVGWLTPYETEGVHWWRFPVEGGIVRVPCPHGGYINMQVRKVGATKFRFEGEAPDLALNLHLKARAAIREIESGCPLLGEEAADHPAVLEGLRDAIRHRVLSTLDVAKRLRVDFLGISNALRLYRPRDWQAMSQGRNHLPELLDLPVQIDVIPVIAEYGRQRW